MASSSDPMVGALLGGRYRLLDAIGHGGTGRVYRAIQEPIGREVAVKVLHPDLDPEGQHDFQARFLREAAQAGRIQHPHVVTVHDYGRTAEGACYIVMEHLRGRTLRAVLSEGALPRPRALRIFTQLMTGLRAVHRAGLVHRDVKPSNVILLRGEEGEDFVKILDFGLVKGADEAAITQVGAFMGTPQYVSPELARGGPADHRTDLYSAGVVLYRMLSGSLPYAGETPISVALQHSRDPYPPMRERAPGSQVPEALEGIVRRLMEKDPQARFADADAVLRALEQVGEEPLPLLTMDALVPTETQEEARPPQERAAGEAPVPPRRGLPMAALAVFLAATIALLTGGVWFATRSAPSSTVSTTAPLIVPPAPLPPPAAPEPPRPRELTLLLSSEPGGAEVWLGEALLGTTPLARRLVLPAEAEGSGDGEGTRSFSLRLAGHQPGELLVDVSGSEAAGHLVLAPLARPGSSNGSPSQAAPSGAMLADDVRFSEAEAAATLAFVNEADGDRIRAAGVAARQANLLVDGRPWPDLVTLAQTPYIGQKTMEALKAGATR